MEESDCTGWVGVDGQFGVVFLVIWVLSYSPGLCSG